MSTKVLFVNLEKCVGCMACVMACSMQHGEMVGPVNSMILPIKVRKLVLNIPIVCRQCAKPLCTDVCPMGALSRDEKTGAIVVNSGRCIACGMCMIACPLGGISIDTDKRQAMKCNLCEGEPLCAKFCAYGAIEYIPIEEAALKRKSEAVGRLTAMLEKIAF